MALRLIAVVLTTLCSLGPSCVNAVPGEVMDPPIHHSHSFDGHSLRDGKEIITHLRVKESQRYYFHIKQDGTPVSIVVTPCGGMVKWSVTQPASREKQELDYESSTASKSHETTPASSSNQEEEEEEAEEIEPISNEDDVINVDVDDDGQDSESVFEIDGHISDEASDETIAAKMKSSRDETSSPSRAAQRPKRRASSPAMEQDFDLATKKSSRLKPGKQQKQKQRDGLSAAGVDSRQVQMLQRNSKRRQSVIVNEVGRSCMQFFSDGLPAGVIHLLIVAQENATAARIYLSTKSGSQIDEFFPRLPRNDRVQVINITNSSVYVEWFPSRNPNVFKKDDIEHCLVLSDERDYHSYCELNPDMNFDREAAFDFSTGNKDQKSNRFYANEYREWGTEVGIFYPYGKGKKPEVVCTKYKTGYTFTDLEPDTKYHLSLFAININSGGSVSYEGASFMTRREKRDSEILTLQDGIMVASYLNPARAAFKLYQFQVRHFHKHVLISLQPCSGSVRVLIYKDGQRVKKSLFEDLKTFVFTNVQPSMITVKVINDDNDAKIYKLWASVRPSRNPYPKLPFDTSIANVEHSRTCQSVSLAWLVTYEKHDYCLYKRMEEDDYFKKLILEESDLCRGPHRDMEKVFCKRVQPRNGTDDFIFEAVVENLKPKTTYRFDLFASKPHRKQTMPYRTIWVKTKPDC